MRAEGLRREAAVPPHLAFTPLRDPFIQHVSTVLAPILFIYAVSQAKSPLAPL